jgi:hypothetical protein
MANIPVSGWTLTVGKIARMNEEQLREARRLIKQRCCNYDQGSCLVLDWPFCNVCAQWITYSVLCKWFRDAVLPNNQELERELYPAQNASWRCAVCGKHFKPSSPRSKYCSKCSLIQRREKTRRRVAKYRARL